MDNLLAANFRLTAQSGNRITLNRTRLKKQFFDALQEDQMAVFQRYFFYEKVALFFHLLIIACC